MKNTLNTQPHKKGSHRHKIMPNSSLSALEARLEAGRTLNRKSRRALEKLTAPKVRAARQ